MFNTRSKMDSPTTAFGKSGYQSAGDLFEVSTSEWPGCSSRSVSKREDVVCLSDAELSHRPVVDDQHRWLRELSDPCRKAPVRMSSTEPCQELRARGEHDVVAPATSQVPECAGDMALSHADRSVYQEPLAGLYELQTGEVPDRR